VQVSELVRSTSVPLATIKYYLREGLLPAARKVTARSSEYDEAHVRRLTLLRVLREVGGLPMTALRELVLAVDDPGLDVHAVFARATDAVAAARRPDPEPDEASRELARTVVARAGWTGVRPDAVDLDNLARVLAQVRGTGLFRVDERVLDLYASAADGIARAEIDALPRGDSRAVELERMVVGTVAFGEVLSILRRLAEEHHDERVTRGSGPAQRAE
jgi:DNA-binding transcriptional MerR regulator